MARAIAYAGMRALDDYCASGDSTALQVAVNQANWLVENAVYRDDFCVWANPVPRPLAFAPTGWASALQSGLAIIFLSQMHQLTRDTRYLETARRAANAFAVPMDSGGVQTLIGDEEHVFYQEVAYPGLPPGCILNGNLIAIAGLAYYADYAQDSAAQSLVEEGIRGVRNLLEAFDANVISYYSLYPQPKGSCRLHYAHSLHVYYLFWLYRRTGDLYFLDYAFRWQRYKTAPIPASLYYDTVSPPTRLAKASDTYHHVLMPVNARALILDLKQVRRIRSFGYTLLDYRPIDYHLSVSKDGQEWQNVLAVKHHRHRHNNHFLDDAEARYVRMSLGRLAPMADKWHGTRPVSRRLQTSQKLRECLRAAVLFFIKPAPLKKRFREFKMHTGWERTARLGVVRVDERSYWEAPTLLITDGQNLASDAPFVSGAASENVWPLSGHAVIYGDLRQSRTEVVYVHVAGMPDTAISEWTMRVEISSDMATWTPLGTSEENATVTLPGQIRFLQSDQAYRYFRIYLDGAFPITVKAIWVEL